jgi:hypothetical protein
VDAFSAYMFRTINNALGVIHINVHAPIDIHTRLSHTLSEPLSALFNRSNIFMIIGISLKLESPILNIRMSKHGHIKSGYIGTCTTHNRSTMHLGLTSTSFFDICSGTAFFAKHLLRHKAMCLRGDARSVLDGAMRIYGSLRHISGHVISASSGLMHIYELGAASNIASRSKFACKQAALVVYALGFPAKLVKLSISRHYSSRLLRSTSRSYSTVRYYTTKPPLPRRLLTALVASLVYIALVLICTLKVLYGFVVFAALVSACSISVVALPAVLISTILCIAILLATIYCTDFFDSCANSTRVTRIFTFISSKASDGSIFYQIVLILSLLTISTALGVCVAPAAIIAAGIIFTCILIAASAAAILCPMFLMALT